MRLNLIRNGIYNHFKGHSYTVLCTADDSKCNTYVVYTDREGNYYARPDYMFFEKVSTEKLGDCQRFIYSGEKDDSIQLPTGGIVFSTEDPGLKFKLKQRGEGYILAKVR